MKTEHAHTIVGVRPELWQRSGYAPNSETPPWGWLPTIALGVMVVVAVGGFISYAGALVGLR